MERKPCLFHGRGCRRTWSVVDTSTEWLCSRHWGLAPRRLRDLHRQAKRHLQKLRVRHFKASPLGWAKGRIARAAMAATKRENRRWGAIVAAVDLALREGAEVALLGRRRPRRDVPTSRHDVAFETAFRRMRGL